jgi:Ca2+-transporting ATPase
MSDWHSLSIGDVEKVLKTNVSKGLDKNKIGALQEKFGKNKLPEEKPLSRLRIFLEQFKSPLIYVLIIAGIISLIIEEWTDAIVIFLAIFINAIFGFFEETKASKTLMKLKKILKVNAVVIRNGNKKQVLQEDIVPGDIIVLNPGDRVPADGRLVEAKSLKINESVLTGEWLSASKNTKVLLKNTPLADRDNMVFMGSSVESGWGKVIVTETGTSTEMGNIATIVKETKEEKSPLQKKLIRFSKVIGIMIAVICIFIFAEGVLEGRDWSLIFVTSVAIAVGGIPEALPVVMTVVLAVGMDRILKKKGLVRRLSSVETLGSSSIICTDKTKTLTEGKMEMVEVIAKDKKLALEIAALNNEVFIENPKDPIEKWIARGDSTSKALVMGAAKRRILKPELEKETKIISRLPFSSSYKFLATVLQKDNKKFLYVCGAPERLLKVSKNNKGFSKRIDVLTGKGLRVVGIAYKKLSSKKRKFKIEDEINDLTFVGSVALKDPLRKDVKETFKICKRAGIRTIIITGDHRRTAKNIAEELGMKIEDKNIIEGNELDGMTDEELMKRIDQIKIYARAEPKHKIRIVKSWQEKGEVVAMTGDGVNDAPALKKADIGIAVGSGTEVAKEASDLVLLNDSFNTIVKAVEQGRIILDNIRKSIAYILADSFTSVILVGFSLILGWPLPILPVQILWNNIVEDTIPDISYAFEPEEDGVMKRKPTPLKAPLLNKEMKILIFGTGLIDEFLTLFLFWILWGYLGLDLMYARTMVFGAISIDTAFVIYCYKNLRKNIWSFNPFTNKWLMLSSIIVFSFFALAVYAPPLQTLLKTVPLSFGDWIILVLVGIVSMLIIEATKWYFISRHETEE